MADKNLEKYQQEQKKIKDEIERKHGKTVEQLYKEREKRAKDVTELRVPDRVPLSINADPANYTEIHRSAAYYDPIGWKRAVREVTVAFEPDMANAGLPVRSAPSAVIRPLVAGMRPLMMLISVDLPEPFGPIRPKISPCSSVRLMR